MGTDRACAARLSPPPPSSQPPHFLPFFPSDHLVLPFALPSPSLPLVHPVPHSLPPPSCRLHRVQWTAILLLLATRATTSCRLQPSASKCYNALVRSVGPLPNETHPIHRLDGPPVQARLVFIWHFSDQRLWQGLAPDRLHSPLASPGLLAVPSNP